MPRGTYQAEDQLDDDGITSEPVHLKAAITMQGETVTFDFSGTDAKGPAPMNCNLTQTFTACVYVLKCLVDPDIPLNEGFYRPIQIIAPAGCAVNATHPTAIVGGREVAMRICELLFKALSDALPISAGGNQGHGLSSGFGGKDPRTKNYYCFYETIAGGYGGRLESDGPDAVQTHFQNTQNAPVEETELNYPVRIPRYSLIPDSEGPGRFRGGLGLCREYVFVDHDAVFTMLADRAKFPAEGLFGGRAGRCARYSLVANGETREIPSKGSIQVTRGEIVRVESPGGGGSGPPWARDVDLVLRDAREGKIAAAMAGERYGVAICPGSWLLDQEQTKILRERQRAKSPGENQ